MAVVFGVAGILLPAVLVGCGAGGGAEHAPAGGPADELTRLP